VFQINGMALFTVVFVVRMVRIERGNIMKDKIKIYYVFTKTLLSRRIDKENMQVVKLSDLKKEIEKFEKNYKKTAFQDSYIMCEEKKWLKLKQNLGVEIN
jgi:hypothetical protein